MNKKCRVFAAVVFSVVLIAVAAIWIKDTKEYTDADKKMAQAMQMKKEAVKEPEIIATPNINNLNIEEDSSENDAVSSPDDPNLYNRINFEALAGVPPENIYGWLYIPDTDIDYVVMKDGIGSPLQYLWKDPYGEKSSTGSLFLYPDIPEDDHKVIYGHRLKDHSLYFGELLNFLDSGYAERHEYAYLYEEDKAVRYRLCYIVNGDESDPVYMYPFYKEEPDYELLIEDIGGRAFFTLKQFQSDKEMLVLSTCSGSRANQPERLYLVFEIGETLFYNEQGGTK